MKFLKVSLITLVLIGLAMLFVSVASAQTPNTISLEGLSQEKINQIQNIVDDGKSTVRQITEAVSPESLSSYAEVGKSIGEGLAATAKELGLAANSFAQTGLGKVALFLIVWKLMLGQIVSNTMSVILGVAWAAVVLRIWTNYFRKICLVERTVIEEFDRNITNADGSFIRDDNGNYITERVTSKSEIMHDINDGTVGGYRFLMFIALGFALIPAMVLVF